MERVTNKYLCPIQIGEMEDCVKLLRMVFHPLNYYVDAVRPHQVEVNMYAYIYIITQNTANYRNEVQVIFSRHPPKQFDKESCVATLNSYLEIEGLPLMNHGYNLGRENE